MLKILQWLGNFFKSNASSGPEEIDGDGPTVAEAQASGHDVVRVVETRSTTASRAGRESKPRARVFFVEKD